MVNIEMVKFEERMTGWEIIFKVKLSTRELSKFNPEPIKYVGDYEIKKQHETILFNVNFDTGELKENETIDERLVLIQRDIENLVYYCL